MPIPPMTRILLPLIILLGLLSTLPSVAPAAASLDLSQYRGKVVYVDFWASWCLPCKKSFPWMEQMQRKYGRRGLQIIAVNLDEEQADADRFLRSYPASFTIVRDPEGVLAERYGIEGMPTALLFAPDGRQAGRHIGFRDSRKAEYEAAIVDLLPKGGDGK